MASLNAPVQPTETHDGRLSAWAVIITATVLVAILGGLATTGESDAWYRAAIKAPGAPPGVTFATAWMILYGLMALGAGLTWSAAGSWRRAEDAMGVYAVQLVANLGWAVLFFQFHAPLAALIDLITLWVLTLMMMASFGRRSELAAYLQLPYLLWLTFAIYLNAFATITG